MFRIITLCNGISFRRKAKKAPRTNLQMDWNGMEHNKRLLTDIQKDLWVGVRIQVRCTYTFPVYNNRIHCIEWQTCDTNLMHMIALTRTRKSVGGWHALLDYKNISFKSNPNGRHFWTISSESGAGECHLCLTFIYGITKFGIGLSTFVKTKYYYYSGI